ncbi:MAG TPA: hypothetical protein VMX57_04075, partial [Planctomycetota bacterium]|nr:hypothetical protein [Planctomycetota bacterium]
MNTRRLPVGPIVLTVLAVAANVTAWMLIGTNVAYYVAEGRDVLLGRYTVGQFSALMVLLVVSVPVLVLAWTQRGRRRSRFVKLLVMTVSVLLTALVFDLVLRLVRPESYVVEGDIEHRRPNAVFTGVTRDVPATAYTYPDVKPGYPDVAYTLTTDARGFRNASTLEACDVVVIGDSFAEGSEVSDNEAWPTLVARSTGLRVVNLGMAGSAPRQYRLVLERIGLGLAPRTVLLML